jgi:hypothetical protein
MKSICFFTALIAFALATGGCGKSPVADTKPDFTAQLTGGEQVPPVSTSASGAASFWLSADGLELRFKLSVTTLNNVTMAHLHLGAAGENGPPVVWLYPSAPPAKVIAGASNGVIAEGVIKAGDLSGSLVGKTVADLVTAIKAHTIYVNVHTQDHGDGEIRGQLQ